MWQSTLQRQVDVSSAANGHTEALEALKTAMNTDTAPFVLFNQCDVCV